MRSFSLEEDLQVTFQLLSGESDSVRVPRSITSWELHHLALSIFPAADANLFFQCTPLKKEYDQPLVAVQEPAVSVDTVLVGGTITDSFIDLMREGRFCTASRFLQIAPKVALLRDASDSTALSWAAYCSRRSLHSPDLICRLLNKARDHVRQPCKGLRFLPLHDAAWGNAPTIVAILLCAAFPSAVHARAKDGSTPQDVGMYHHHRTFCWPRVDELLESAKKLRTQFKHARSLSAARRLGTGNKVVAMVKLKLLEAAVADCLGLPHAIAARVADFVETPVLEQLSAKQAWISHAAAANDNVDLDLHAAANDNIDLDVGASREGVGRRRQRRLLNGRNADVRCGQRGRQRPSRGRCLRVSNCVQQTDPDSVEHIREAHIKGHFAGFRRARNSKCSFRSVSEVAVGSVVHRLISHTVRAVQKEETEPRAVWPDKMQLFNDRARDRDAKYEVAFSTS